MSFSLAHHYTGNAEGSTLRKSLGWLGGVSERFVNQHPGVRGQETGRLDRDHGNHRADRGQAPLARLRGHDPPVCFHAAAVHMVLSLIE
jgi:hypothetical protein